MVARQGPIAGCSSVNNVWQVGPSPPWPLVVVVIDEAHTFFNEARATSPRSSPTTPSSRSRPTVEELIRKGRNVAIQVILPTQKATGDAIPTRIRDNCQVAVTFATRTLDGAVAALGEEIRQHPDASPVLLNDPAYVGVAVTSLPGRPGFHRVRTPSGRPPSGRRHHPGHRRAAARPGRAAGRAGAGAAGRATTMPAPGDVA